MKQLKKILAGIIALLTLVLVVVLMPEYSFAADELTGVSAMDITHMMGKGWNLGNTLDSIGGRKDDVLTHETAWGNPITNKDLIHGVKEAGFTTIRIPTTWFNYIDEKDGYKIKPEYMARVREIVDMAYDEGLFIILNVHHESWVNSKNLEFDKETLAKELSAVWAQIAEEFADYDQHLIFEGMNEPRYEGASYEWTGNSTCYENLNYLNKVFVETVRNNGKGHNGERGLMIPSYAAQCSGTALRAMVIPEHDGVQYDNIIISTHCYNPYDLCLSDAKSEFNPKNSADTSSITQVFTDIQATFLSKGIPVVIGECGITNTNDNLSAREAWFAFFGNKASEYNVPAVVWDNGHNGKSGGESHAYLDRKTGNMLYPSLIRAFVYGSVDEDAGVLKDTFIDFEPFEKNGETNIAEPTSLGFSPTKLGKARVNHTVGVENGNSLEVDPGYIKKDTANLNIKKYNGLALKITAYVCSKSSEDITLGIVGMDDVKVTGTVGTEWSKYTLYVKLPNKMQEDWTAYFVGTNKDVFYIDDISIEMIDESEMGESSVVGESEVITSGSSDELTGEAISEADASQGVATDNSSKTKQLLLVFGISLLAIVLVVVITQVIKRKK